jgi:uncharacterized protein (TIRG00374 family)
VKPIQKMVTTILKGIVTLAIITLLINKLGWKSIASTVSTAKPVWLIIAIIIFLISALLGVVQWRILLKNRGISFPLTRTFRLYFIGMFFNNFVLGGFVGDALKVVSIKSQNGRGKAGFAATVLDRFAGLWAMCGFAVIGSIILLRHGALTNGKIGTAVIALFVAFLLFASILTLLISKKLQQYAFKCIEIFPFSAKTRVRDIFSEMLFEAHDAHILIRVAVLSAIIQLMRISVHILSAHSLGLLTGDNFHYFFIFVPIIAMLMTLPLPFGVREAAGGTLFSMAGFQTEAAYVMGFLASLVGLAASFLGGLFYIMDRTVYKEKHG